MEQSINHNFFFPHPPERVWEYLTKVELMEQWLMKSDFQPIIGHAFQFRTNPVPHLNFDGIFYCKVLEIIPFKKLSYSWRAGPGKGKITLDSVVIWILEPKDNGTDLFLVHSGFSKSENLEMYKALLNGWIKNIHKIADRLNAIQHDATNS